MSYEIDRNPTVEPSLVEMTETALTSLHEATKKSKKGMFITYLTPTPNHPRFLHHD